MVNLGSVATAGLCESGERGLGEYRRIDLSNVVLKQASEQRIVVVYKLYRPERGESVARVKVSPEFSNVLDAKQMMWEMRRYCTHACLYRVSGEGKVTQQDAQKAFDASMPQEAV